MTVNELVANMKAVSAELQKWEARAEGEENDAKREAFADEVTAKQAEFDGLGEQLAGLKAKEKRAKVIADAEASAKAVDTTNKDRLGNVSITDGLHNKRVELMQRDAVSRAYMLAPPGKCKDAIESYAKEYGDKRVDAVVTDDGIRMPSNIDRYMVWGMKGLTGAKVGTDPILTSDVAGTQSGGGALLHDTFVPELQKLPQLNANLASLCRVKRSVGKSAIFPFVDQTAAAPFGVVGTWDAEGATATESAPTFDSITIGTDRLALFTDVSEKELRVNEIGLEAELAWMFRGEFMRKVDTAIVTGTGSGQPRGINLSDSISDGVNIVARETVNTISYTDLSNLQFGGAVGTRSTSLYILSDGVSSAMQYIMGLDDSSGRAVLRREDMGWEQGPIPRLLGFRYIPTEANIQALGNRGDVIFGDMNQYGFVVDLETSIARSDHFKFTSGLVVFRVFSYVGGQTLGHDAFSLLADASGESSSSSSTSSST